MKFPQRIVFVLVTSVSWCALSAWSLGADESTETVSLDLTAALQQALRANPQLHAKRQALGAAQGRVAQADLLFQQNPRLSVDVDYRHRRFALPTGKSGADAEVRLLQEIEIAGQRGHRQEAAAKNLAQAEWSISDAERLLRLEVTQVFTALLAAQDPLAAHRQLLTTQEELLQAGRERFGRGDIPVLELDTLRLNRDRTRKTLLTTEQEQLLLEQRLRALLGLDAERAVVASGRLPEMAAPATARTLTATRATLTDCALSTRPDMKAAQLVLESREAELHLAQARRMPNIFIGPLYKFDNEDQVIGGSINIPLPPFHRNLEEVATALANRDVAHTELQARRLAVAQEVASAHARVEVAVARLASYEPTYIDNLAQSAAFARKAYETGELSIFEFSVARDRVAQAHVSYLEATLAYVHARAELDARLAFGCLSETSRETEGQ